MSFPELPKTSAATSIKGLKMAACVPRLYADVQGDLDGCSIVYVDSYKEFGRFLFDLELYNLPDVLLVEVDDAGLCFDLVAQIRQNLLLKGIIIILLACEKGPWYERAKKAGVHDIYIAPINYTHLTERVQFLVRFKLIKPRLEELDSQVATEYKMPVVKRLFDVLFSGTLILLLSPLFLLVGLIILVDSGWPVIYKSKRVGTGYRVFDFYKFRSMRKDADKMVTNMAGLNQYAGEGGKSAFVKFRNDPRITRFGQAIRKTSIDELPQLFNILKGDMSTVGNRPLPLYEAEMLTSNEWTQRFLAPAGLTGLWQVSKRGKEDMSERERKKLDNFYAQKHSFLFDMKILLGTVPALFQKEKV